MVVVVRNFDLHATLGDVVQEWRSIAVKITRQAQFLRRSHTLVEPERC